MPLDIINTNSSKPKVKRINIPRTHSNIENESQFSQINYRSYIENDSVIPITVRTRLHELFLQIERELECAYSENIVLQEKIDVLTEKLERESFSTDKHGDLNDLENISKIQISKTKGATGFQKVTAHKLKAQTSKIVSSFKGPTTTCSLIRQFSGHKDGIWEVTVAKNGQLLIGTASADHSACVWNIENSKCLLRYLGHTGSVNSIQFHPSKDIVLTASGDQTAHIWQAAVTWDSLKRHSSEEELEAGERDELLLFNDDGTVFDGSPSLRTPVQELTGHTSVVSSADWLPGGDHVITASWDRTASLYDVETGDLLQSLGGHDLELTHASSHPVQRLVVTSSKDTTFRLWDFREPIHSVSVFQGHTETVTSAVFTREDKVVSGSDDRSVKVWDVRNMRSPLATIRSDSCVNKLAVSSNGIIAIPHDNKHVRLFDLNGQRIVRLPRTSRQGHNRMVSSVAWADETAQCNLFTSGFDRLILGWSVQLAKDM